MLLQARLIQVVLLAAIENAFKVTPPLSSLMDLQMLLQITTGGELLRAVGTFEWLIASMDSLMPYQVGYLRESLGAAGMVAGVWLLLVMHSSVLLERRVLSKSLITRVAIEDKYLSQKGSIIDE